MRAFTASLSGGALIVHLLQFTLFALALGSEKGTFLRKRK
jgi:hypothetical protein